MRHPRAVLPLLMLLVTGVPSVLMATRLSLPSIPDFRLPSGGSVNTVFPAARGGAAPYTYSLSGQPPGISFAPGTRRASGTLPTVAAETTYTVTYSVTDGAGASASVSFSATVVPPPAPPPPPSPPPPPPPPPPASSLSLPAIPDFTLPSGGSVDTVFPAATGGAPPYGYSLSGQPPGINFSPGTRRASGTLPTVTTDTDYTVTYSVRDGTGATASVTFTTTVTAPASTIRRDPIPPGTIRPADPPDVTVQATYRLPFTVSESGAAEKSYEFSLSSSDQVTVSLTGMNRDIDCRVNSSRCTNRAGTRDDSWSGTLAAGTHTVTVYPYNADSGNWTLSVSGTSASPPPPPPPPSPPSPPPSGPVSPPTPATCPTGFDYDAGTAQCERVEPFQMRASETNVSSRQSYSFELHSSQRVSVSLTGMTRDFDCRVGSHYCTNRWGTADDAWAGSLGSGTHTVVVYPYGSGGPGDYTLTITIPGVSLVTIAQPFGAPDAEDDETCRLDGEEIECPTPDETLDVVGEDPGTPEEPDGTTPPETDPPPETPDPDPPPTTTTPSDVIGSLKHVVEATKLDCRGMNFEVNERLGTTHGGTNTTRTGHSGIDMNTKGVRSKFYAPVSGTLSYDDQDRNVDDDGNVTWGSGCGHYAKILRSDRTYVIICHLDPAHDVTPGTISAGDLIGKDGQTGHNSGPHLHLAYKRSVRDILNPFDLWGGNSSVENEGFSFDDSDPTTCEEPE